MEKAKSFLVVLAGSASVIGLIFIGTSLLMGTEWIEKYRLFILSHGVYWLIFPPILWAFRTSSTQPIFQSPEVKKTLGNSVILVDRSDWLSHQTAVAVYYTDDEVERMLCIGQVINIQTNGLIQIELQPPNETGDFDKKLADLRQNLLIKPGIWR